MTRKKSEPSDTIPPAAAEQVAREGESAPPPSGIAETHPNPAPAWDDQPTLNLTGDPTPVLPHEAGAPTASDAAEDEAAGVEEARADTRSPAGAAGGARLRERQAGEVG